MAITTADGWFAAARQALFIRKTQAAVSVAANPHTLLDRAGNPGAGSLAVGNTANGLVPTGALAGVPVINAFGGAAKGYLASCIFRNSVSGGLTLYDRLWHAGSINLNALATTNFTVQPSYTARLPGGTDFGNLDILLEFNVAVSATATTVAVGYTNEAGTAARSTGASASLSGFITGRIIQMPLQAGDKGVQKIDSLTVGGVVATTGSVNVIVARRLADFDIRTANGIDAQAWDMLGAPEVFASSCLFPVAIPDGASTGTPVLTLSILNG